MVHKLLNFISVTINNHRTKILLVLSCFTYISLLGLIWVSNDPICTNSAIVNSIDIVRGGKKDAVYQCNSKQKSKYDPKIEKIIKSVNQKIAAIENYLYANSPISESEKTRFSMQINYDRLLQYELSDSQLKIGALLLEEPGNLERSLIKYWLRKKISDRPLRSRYLLEFSSDRPAVKRLIVALLVAKLNPIAVTTRSNAIGETLIIARIK